jgi:hypothetical protein
MKQETAVEQLIERLGPNYSHEHNLNASIVLQDLVDRKDFTCHFATKDNLQRIVDYSLPTSELTVENRSSRLAAVQVLNLLIQN